MQRILNYLRISVTDRCNLRCIYCMPKNGVKLKKHSEIINIEEIYFLVKSLSEIGFNKIRLTGGEPLLKKNIEVLIKNISSIKKIKDISITTNGILLKDKIKKLKESGLNRLNISIDTLNEKKFKYITRFGNISDVLKGIDEALKLKISPLKLNVVVIKNFNDNEILYFVDFAKEKKIQVRFIELMPVGTISKEFKEKYFPIKKVKNIILKKNKLTYTNKIITNGPSENFIIDNTNTSVGFIESFNNHFCERCNKIRITSDKKVRLCLHNNIEYDIQRLLIKKDSNEIKRFFKKIILLKPEKHNMFQKKWSEKDRTMSQIGG